MSEHKEFIPYARPSLEEDDISAVTRVLKTQWLTRGPEVKKFEEEFATYCGARFAVACSSGTAALHLASLALGLEPGDWVITSPITFLATANCVRFVGADVIFSDVESDTINLSPSKLKTTLDSKKHLKIKSIFPVHFAGQPADMEEIFTIAQSQGLKIVEDASHAVGAHYRTKRGEKVKVGSCKHSDMTTFSFHATKHITMGEGGLVTTNDESLYHQLKLFRNHGMQQDQFQQTALAYTSHGTKNPWYYEMKNFGFNYHATDINCALARNQLTKIDKNLQSRYEIAKMYHPLLASRFPGIIRPLQAEPMSNHAYHLFPVRINFKKLGITRASLMNMLNQNGIGTQVHYIPLHLQPYYANLYNTKQGDFPIAESYYEEALSLPMFPTLIQKDISKIITVLEERVLNHP